MQEHTYLASFTHVDMSGTLQNIAIDKMTNISAVRTSAIVQYAERMRSSGEMVEAANATKHTFKAFAAKQSTSRCRLRCQHMVVLCPTVCLSGVLLRMDDERNPLLESILRPPAPVLRVQRLPHSGAACVP